MSTKINTTTEKTTISIITLATGEVETTVEAGDTVMSVISKVSKISLDAMELTINGKPAKKDTPVPAKDKDGKPTTVAAMPQVAGGR